MQSYYTRSINERINRLMRNNGTAIYIPKHGKRTKKRR